MTDIIERASNKYQNEGLLGLCRGGVNLVDRNVFQKILKHSKYKYPIYTWKNRRSARSHMNRIVEKGIGQPILELNLKKHKSSDKVFILGSGSSISEISESEWSHIDKHDSIGLNKWPIHDHTPTYLVFEVRLGETRQDFVDDYFELLDKKREQYKQVPKIIKDVSAISHNITRSHLPDWLSNELIISCDENFHEIIGWNSTVEENERLLRYLDNANYFCKGGDIKLLYRKRGSISYLLHLAVLLGYDDIVLCGVDMINSDYFFEVEYDYYANKDFPIPGSVKDKSDKSGTEQPHRTNDPSVGELTLAKVIHSINDTILKKKDINLYVENDISALHPKIKEYDY